MKVLRFNRHKLFSAEDVSKVMKLSRKVENHNFEVGKSGFCLLNNNLFGMFDGFLYESTLELAENYPTELRTDIVELYNEIHSHIVANGESETQIL